MSSDGGNSSDTEWSDDRGDYENVPRDDNVPNDEPAGDNGEEPGDNGENVDPLVAEPDQSRDIDDGDNVGVVDGDTSGSQKDGADLSDTEPGDNMGSDNEGDGASYENVFPAGGSADGIGDGTGNGIENAETGSDTQESITDVTSGFTAEQPTTEDPGDQSNGGTDEGEPSPDSDQVGESDAGTESEAQSDGLHYVAQSNVVPTIVSVDPPSAPPTPPPAEDVVEKSTATSIQVQSINNRGDIGGDPYTSATSIQVQGVNNRDDIGGDPYTSGDHVSVASIGDTTERNVVLIPVTTNDERSPSVAASTSGMSNGDPRSGFSAYYSKTTAAPAPTDQGFVVVVPVGSAPPSPDVTSARKVSTSVSTSGAVTLDNDCERSLVYQSDTSSHIISNNTGTIIRIGGGKGVTANGDVVKAPPVPVSHDGVTVLAVGLPETQRATSNGDVAVVTIDTNRQPGKGESGSTVFTPGLHAVPEPAPTPAPLQTHSPSPSRTTYTKSQSHYNSSDYMNGRRHQRPPTASTQRPVAAQMSDNDPAWQEKYGQAAGRPWVIAALVVCMLIVVGIGTYFILQQANVVD